MANLDLIDLRFGDETGFSRLPNIPYGWLPKGKQTGIKADNKRVLNVFGLMSLDQKLISYPTSKTINSQFLISCLNDFVTLIDKPTVIVLDRAPWHTSQAIKEQIPQWQQSNLFLFYLPPYSPQLNAIEILWRFIKYKWLQPKDYLSAQELEAAILSLLKSFGKQHHINFSMNFNLLQ